MARDPMGQSLERVRPSLSTVQIEMKKSRTILKKPKPFEVTSFYKESDKGCAIMMGTLLEEALEELHEAHVNLVCPVKAESLPRLFSAFGPLSTFDGKTLLGFAFGLISTEEHEELNLFRKIRNEAAHSRYEFSLEDDGIRALISQCKSFDKAFPPDSTETQQLKDAPVDPEFRQLSEAKQLFLLNARALELFLLDRVYNKEMEHFKLLKTEAETRRLHEEMKKLHGE
jgi:DNA-binding MltR family transcriptional regulator